MWGVLDAYNIAATGHSSRPQGHYVGSNSDVEDPRVDPKILDRIQKSLPHLDPKTSRPAAVGRGTDHDTSRDIQTNFGPPKYAIAEAQRGGGNGYDSSTGTFVDNRDPFDRGTGCGGSDGSSGGNGGDCSIM